MANAIDVCWPETKHLLYVFHIWKNFYKHIRPLFSGKNVTWKKVAGMFWYLCKTSEESQQLHFDAKFDELIAYVEANGIAAEELMNRKLSWLQSAKIIKEKWAACYTWRLRTFGIHSTQRAEGIHSSTSVFCSKKSTLMQIVRNLERMAEEQNLSSRMAAVDRMLGLTIGRNPVLLPVCERLQSFVCPFARIMMNAQAVQLVRYQCSELTVGSNVDEEECQVIERQSKVFVVDNHVDTQSADLQEVGEDTTIMMAPDHGIDDLSSGSRNLSHVSSLTGCTCQCPKCWGLPCRHMFRVMMHLGCNTYEHATIVSSTLCIMKLDSFLLILFQCHNFEIIGD